MAELKKSSFVRAVAMLASGTVLGHTVTLAAFPILTRLYSPSNFSDLAVFVAIVTIVSTVACLRFDIAIPLPERRAEALSLVGLSVVSATLVGSILLILTIWFNKDFAELAGAPSIANLLWLAPVSIWLAAIYSALQFFATREKEYKRIAKTRVTRSVSAAAIQLGLGTFSTGSVGLVVGHAFSSGAGIGALLRERLGRKLLRIRKLSLKHVRKTAYSYKRFPLLSAPEALANISAIQLPIIIISASSNGHQAGFLMLAMKLMQAPMALLGNSIAQVYLGTAPTQLRNGNLASFTIATFSSLLKLGAGPIIAAAIIAPGLFPVIFGDEWGGAGKLLVWMAPWFALQFVTSPLAMCLHITGNQLSALVLQLVGFVIRVGAVIFAIAYMQEHVAEVYALSGVVFYTGYLFIVMRKAGVSSFELVRTSVRSAPIIGAWILAACIANYIWSHIWQSLSG